MAVLFLSGFDIFGPANSNSTAVAALLTAGEWTSTSGTLNIVAPLSATGQALNFAASSNTTKTLSANYPRLIGGIRFSSTLAGIVGIGLQDGAGATASISINTTGLFSVRNGSATAGTILGTSTVSVTANTTHYLEWDITINNSGSYQLWLDGVSVLSGSGDTQSGSNAFANGVQLVSGTSGVCTFDDLYLFDNTGSTNNAVLLTSPRIETQFPTGDGAVQFAVGAGILGAPGVRGLTANPSTTNRIILRPYVAPAACTLQSITIVPAQTTTNNVRPVVYADSAGVAGTLMSAGATIGSLTSGVALTMPLTTPQTLSAGVRYWLGFMIENQSQLNYQDALNQGYAGAATFSGGAPASAPAMSATNSFIVSGNLTGLSGNNWYSVGQNPPVGGSSYVYEATVGEEDLYTYPALSAPPSAIYAVAVKASVAKSDAGSKTVSMRMKSGATDSAGTGGTQAPGTSYGWLTSHFPTDPNGSVAWTQSALNAAQSGVKVES